MKGDPECSVTNSFIVFSYYGNSIFFYRALEKTECLSRNKIYAVLFLEHWIYIYQRFNQIYIFLERV